MANEGPSSFLGREVSVRAVVPIWEGLRALGLDPEELAAGTGYSVEHLRTMNERISWAAFAKLLQNLGAKCSEEQIVELGLSAMDSPFFRAMILPARMLFGADQIIEWAFGGNGPPSQLITCNQAKLVRIGPGHMRLEVRCKPGYEPSRENALLLRGSLIGLGGMGGQRVTVSLTMQERGMDYEIRMPATTGLWSRARRLFSRVDSEEQLARANTELYDRYADLEREVSARIAAEAELRRSEQRYRELFENAPMPMWVFDVETLRFLAVNRAAVNAYGFTAEEFTAMTLAEIRPPEDVEPLREDVSRFRDATRIWRHRKKDGGIIHVQVTARDLTFEGRSARLAHVFDMTQRIALEDQLRQAQKMEAIGLLAGGVAHDFNNLLMVISSYAELMLRDSSAKRDDLRAIRGAAERGADLTQKLLAFARRKMIEPRVLDLGEIVEDMRVLLNPVLESGHALVLDIARTRGLVRVDRGGIEQIVMNLAVNARDAMPTGGTIKVSIRDITVDEEFARNNVGIMPGPHVALVVADTGMGMNEATRTRVFEPFFTTKPVGKGSGLGLSTVLGIVQQNGGHIHIDSEPGLGTSIAIYFPRCEPTKEVPVHDGQPTILVIEDDDVLRSAARDVLEEHGYHVLVAGDAPTALAVCDSDAQIDLVLSDVALPKTDGIELAKLLRVQRPDLRVLWMSGHVVEIGSHDRSSAFLKKPFTAELLVERVRSLL